jgi:hypothetical protein
VTTFFPNYGAEGACWATTPTDPACAYVPRGRGGDSDDTDDEDD